MSVFICALLNSNCNTATRHYVNVGKCEKDQFCAYHLVKVEGGARSGMRGWGWRKTARVIGCSRPSPQLRVIRFLNKDCFFGFALVIFDDFSGAQLELCLPLRTMSLSPSTLDGFRCCLLHCVPCRNILPNNRFVFPLSRCIIFVQNEVFLSLVFTVSSRLPGWRSPQIGTNTAYLQLIIRLYSQIGSLNRSYVATVQIRLQWICRWPASFVKKIYAHGIILNWIILN